MEGVHHIYTLGEQPSPQSLCCQISRKEDNFEATFSFAHDCLGPIESSVLELGTGYSPENRKL